MTSNASPPDTAIREIPLSRLAPAPENVRKTPAGAAADAELKASIAAHGLLENLVVRPGDPHEDGGTRFAVVAGGRRLAALKTLAEEDTLDPDHPVPCLVAAAGDAGELSLAENTVRAAMHPADQVVAFCELAGAGATVAAIAVRFGVTERMVAQRLRLGNAAPELLDAYRAGDIDLETLKAFAVTADPARQRAAWEQVSAQGYRPSAWQVKRLLTEERVPGSAAIARFVGVDAYEAAGGAVLRDLFADEGENGVWLEDPARLNRLAMDKLTVVADELAARWKWAEAAIEMDWSATARYGRIHPEPAAPTEDEKAEIEKLRLRYDALANLDEEDWTDDLVEEAGTVEERLDAIEGEVEARATFRREDCAVAGCIATIGRDGMLQVVQGLVKPEDMPKPAERSGETAGNGHAAADTGRIHGPAISAPVSSPKDRGAEARKDAGVGVGLADDLRAVRTALVKAHLAGDFAAAFDLVLFQLARSVFAGGCKAHALDIAVNETADRPMTRMNDEDFAAWSPGEAMLEDRSGLSLDWLEIADDGDAFAALRALPQAEKQTLFAACAARTVKGQLAFEPQARPELEATVARLDIGFATHVRPAAGMYWSRIAKARIHASAVGRVTRIYASTLADIFTETLQNSRRAGATRVRIAVAASPAPRTGTAGETRFTVTITDDGAGIADPAVLLSFGENGWPHDLVHREDAAGFGFASLSRRGCTVSSRPRAPDGNTMPGWRVELAPAHFLGEADARVHDDHGAPVPHGTSISFQATETAAAIRQAAETAARHYPLPVVLTDSPLAGATEDGSGGEVLPRRAFLDGAVRAEPWRGLTFGVFTGRHRGYNDPDLNFFGLTLPAGLPTVETVHGATWSVRADAGDCPELELVLPARKEAVENAFLKEMRTTARQAVYRAMAADPDPRPAFADWRRAREAGIDLAPPPALLRPWRPAVADVDDWREAPKPAAAGPDALVMDCDPEPPEAQALGRAAERLRLAESLFEADRRLDGYDWYGRLGRVTGIGTEVTLDGKRHLLADVPLPERTGTVNAGLPPRPAAIRMTLAVRPAEGPAATLGIPADLAFAGEAWCWLEDAMPLVAVDSTLQPHALADLLRAGFFSPSDDADADSWETQRDRFDEAALHLATRLLLSDEDACRASIAEAVRRDLFWLVPRNRTVDIRVRRPDVTVTLGEAAADDAS